MTDGTSDAKRRAARERRERRQARTQSLKQWGTGKLAQTPEIRLPGKTPDALKQVSAMAADSWWRLRQRLPVVPIALGSVGVVVLLTVLGAVFSPTIGPNVWALDVRLSGLTVPEAETALVAHWNEALTINIMLGSEQIARVRPAELGLMLDAGTMAEQARSARLSGFPFGIAIEPLVTGDDGLVQDYLLSIANQVYIPPVEASYAWEGGELVGVMGTPSRELDIALSAQRLLQDPTSVVETGRFDLLTFQTPPLVSDPAPYLDEAYAFVSAAEQFTLMGYDPFTDETFPWRTTREEMTRWLAAGVNGLVVQEDAFERFIGAINGQLQTGDNRRYVAEQETIARLNAALTTGETEVRLRVRYLRTTYTIESGDTGQAIGRKTGLPFQLINDVNPGVDWNALSIGQEIALPERDVVLPENPISNKRIVVDLDRLWLVAYEDDAVVFHWAVSSGRSNAPTYPGIFQILEKVDVAYGSSFALCGEGGDCGQWQMDWFMGIYEVAPNLMNGFHGAVLLPNGAYLDGGSVQTRSTYGCVMSDNEQAKLLYDWAEVGTIVEIVSSEFVPQSDLAVQAVQFIDALAAVPPHSADIAQLP